LVSLLAANYAGFNSMVATRGSSYAMIYVPNGLPCRVVLGQISGDQVYVSWFNPRTGQFTVVRESGTSQRLHTAGTTIGYLCLTVSKGDRPFFLLRF